MKTLWTPWRMEHVQGLAKKPDHCLFEPRGTACQDREQLLLYRDRSVVVLLNRFPYSNGHLLIAPCRHLSCLTDLNADEAAALITMTQRATDIVRRHLFPDGFNIGCNIGETAGAGIADHLHVHVVPRWRDDHNFITVISEIRTIPEHLLLTFDRLAADFSALQTE
jgi:ATP adenylyltransferase